MQFPTLGRNAHVTWPDGVQSPAIITRTADDTVGELPDWLLAAHDRWGNSPQQELDESAVDLMVFGLTIVYPLYGVQYAAFGAPGFWNWPLGTPGYGQLCPAPLSDVCDAEKELLP